MICYDQIIHIVHLCFVVDISIKRHIEFRDRPEINIYIYIYIAYIYIQNKHFSFNFHRKHSIFIRSLISSSFSRTRFSLVVFKHTDFKVRYT